MATSDIAYDRENKKRIERIGTSNGRNRLLRYLNNNTQIECQCEKCNHVFIVGKVTFYLGQGVCRKCKHNEKQCKFINKKVNSITILELRPKGKCLAICACSKIKIMNIDNIVRGKSKTCGSCLGGVSEKERRAYTLLKYRCETPTSPDYKNYGGRGIQNKFKDFYEFINAIGDMPQTGKWTVDRIDVNGHYEKDNVRWATPSMQGLNRRNTVYLTYNNCTKTLLEWAVIKGLKYSTVKERLNRKWNVKDALDQPATRHRLTFRK